MIVWPRIRIIVTPSRPEDENENMNQEIEQI